MRLIAQAFKNSQILILAQKGSIANIIANNNISCWKFSYNISKASKLVCHFSSLILLHLQFPHMYIDIAIIGVMYFYYPLHVVYVCLVSYEHQ